MATIVFIIAPENYQEMEYETPKKVLSQKGHEIITACKNKEAVSHMGTITTADIMLNDVNSNDYDAIAFIGGPGSYTYFDDQKALSLAKEFHDAGKLTCAICAAPTILANAGILEGKTTTAFESQGAALTAKEANFTGNPVEQDGIIITANGPAAAEAFGEKINTALNGPTETPTIKST